MQGLLNKILSNNKFGEPVKPPLHRYVLAHAAGVSAGIGVVGALALMLGGLHSQGALIPRAGVVIWILLAAVPVAAIGWIVGIIFLWGMMLGHIAARLQGWPFAVGDRSGFSAGDTRTRLRRFTRCGRKKAKSVSNWDQGRKRRLRMCIVRWPFAEHRTPNQTVQRTGASRFAQRQIERHRRLAPVADLCVRPFDGRRTCRITQWFVFSQGRRTVGRPTESLEVQLSRGAAAGLVYSHVQEEGWVAGPKRIPLFVALFLFSVTDSLFKFLIADGRIR